MTTSQQCRQYGIAVDALRHKVRSDAEMAVNADVRTAMHLLADDLLTAVTRFDAFTHIFDQVAETRHDANRQL
jgi:hypothetical protein